MKEVIKEVPVEKIVCVEKLVEAPAKTEEIPSKPQIITITEQVVLSKSALTKFSNSALTK